MIISADYQRKDLTAYDEEPLMRQAMNALLLLGVAGLLVPSLMAQRRVGGDVDILISHNRDGFVKNFSNESIYHILVDRFANGNTQNDCFDEPRFCRRGDHSDWFRYQGGDLRGVIQKLDYLRDLGVSRIWLTPIFENQQITAWEPRYGRQEEMTSFHGYWVRDWFRLNPFFTDRGERDFGTMDELVARAKELGIKIYLDSVANHTSKLNPTQWSLDRLGNLEPLNWGAGQSHRAALFRDGSYVTSIDEDARSAQQDPHYQKKFHQTWRDIGQVHGESDWTNPEILENYNLMELADIDQDHPAMNEYLMSAHQFWLERYPDLAGYRMDTIKHVSPRFWRRFSKELLSRFPNAEVFGEYYNGGASEPGARDFYNNTSMSMLDFQFRQALVDVFMGDQPFDKIMDVWRADHQLNDASALITYLDSHDHARLRGQLSLERMRLAIGLWLLSRGVPCIYYGMEQDLFVENDPGDPYNRPMMRSFDTTHPLFGFMKTLLRLRRENSALRYGTTHILHLTQNIFGFERLDGERQIFVAMSKNYREGSDTFTMKGLKFADGTYRDLLSGKTYRVHDGQIEVSLAYAEMIVLAR